ncbi:MAG: hypothetical protein FWC43_00595 [Planctomycetaceae bacterium]|nr:hypothetical protein [Planctomycetaceae bacterium]
MAGSKQTADSRRQTAETKEKLPSAICRLPSAVCRLPSAVCRLLAICRLPSAVCYLLSILLLFTTLLFYDSSAPAQSGKKVTSRHSGTEVIQNAILRFQKVKTIESKVRLKCRFFGEGYGGSGNYCEKRLPTLQDAAVSPNRFLLDLRFQADSLSSLENRSSTLKVFTTGSYLWKYSQIENEKSLERVDLVKLQDILTRSQKGNESNSRLQPVELGEFTSLGGLEGTLRQMTKFYDFDSASVESAVLNEEKRAVWKVSAKLKPDILKAMLESYGGETAIARHGGEHIPSAVCLYFGKTDFFPYQISYYGGVKENPFNDPPSIDWEYLKVTINGDDIATSIFDFTSPPEDVFINDVTDFYADRILRGN